MIRFLPILLLVLQSLPITAPLEAATEAVQQMTCCGDSCACAVRTCKCGAPEDTTPATKNTPFSISSIDLAPPLVSAQYRLPALAQAGELVTVPCATIVVASNNCRQSLLGRWQN